MIRETMSAESDNPGRLLGELADELSQLVRSDLELATAERLPEIRRVATETVVLAAAAVAGVFAAAAATWAAGIGLAHAIPAWAAALVLSGAWLVGAAVLFNHEHSRKLFARLSDERGKDVVASGRAERQQSEQALRITAERVAQALLKEAEAQGLRAASSVATRGAHEAEREAQHLISEVADALLERGKSGLGILERITKPPEEPES